LLIELARLVHGIMSDQDEDIVDISLEVLSCPALLHTGSALRG
jgi:hypothetical protein